MAEYKLVDAEQLDGAMLATAEAIREKSDSTELIEWNVETGYAAPIRAIKGGGDLNFEVIGGTVRPSSPSKNTIWVNTPNEITGWIFSSECPDEFVESANGAVWIALSDDGNVEFNAVADDGNLIHLKTSSVYQKTNGSWEGVVAEIYQNEVWNLWWNGVLYDAGNEYEAVTGGWVAENFATADVVGTLTKYESYMSVLNVTYANTGAVTSKAVNLKGYSTLNVSYKAASGSIDTVVRVSTNFPSGTTAASVDGTASTTLKTISLPLGDNGLDGSYEIGIRGKSTSVPLQIHKVWLT